MIKERIRYYSSFSDDFEQSAEQDFELPRDYKYVRTDPLSRLLSAVIYAIALIFGSVYCRLFLHVKIIGRKKLKEAGDGCFIYGNHTQPIGDVFIPALASFPKRIYTIASPANYGIPVIGKLLPYLGAIPTAGTVSALKELGRSVELRLSEGHPIVVYPEAHVWSYYTEIRPYADTVFRMSAKSDKPVYVMTTTYKSSRYHKKPRIKVFIDGPIYQKDGTIRERSAALCNEVYRTMTERAAESDVSYIKYVQR